MRAALLPALFFVFFQSRLLHLLLFPSIDLDLDLCDVWNDWAVQCNAKQTKKRWG